MESMPDYYETLQVSPGADFETIEKVYRHLARRFHPDNTESGDGDRFRLVNEAFRVLVDPEKRAAYDVHYYSHQDRRSQILEVAASTDLSRNDSAMHQGILTLLYTARRNDALRPGLGPMEIGRMLDCPEKHMDFHLWYLKEKGWIQMTDSGQYAITAHGVDAVLEQGPSRDRRRFITEGARPAEGGGGNGGHGDPSAPVSDEESKTSSGSP